MNRKIKLLLFAFAGLIVILAAISFGFYYYDKVILGSVDLAEIVDAKITYSFNGDEVVEGDDGYNASEHMITTYASKKTSMDTEEYPQLCDLHATLDIETEISIRIRVRINDAWINHKIFYAGGDKSEYTNRPLDNEDGSTPFTFDTNWTYDEKTGYLYYNEVLKAGSYSLDFLVNDEVNEDMKYYFTYTTAAVSYRESKHCELQITVEAVQASRAYAVWGVK